MWCNYQPLILPYELLNIIFMDEIIGTLMWRINDEAEFVNATINVLDRVHKEYLTVCQTELTTKNIEFSFVINRRTVKYNVYGRGCGVNRTINGEPGGRAGNARLTQNRFHKRYSTVINNNYRN